MIVETEDRVLEDRARSAHDRAAAATLEDARADAPRRSGRYAASLERRDSETEAGPVTRIGSPLPQAGAIERGADVGARRGPHMGPVGSLDRAGRAYARHMTDELRRGAV